MPLHVRQYRKLANFPFSYQLMLAVASWLGWQNAELDILGDQNVPVNFYKVKEISERVKV